MKNGRDGNQKHGEEQKHENFNNGLEIKELITEGPKSATNYAKLIRQSKTHIARMSANHAINHKDENGRTPLYKAVSENNYNEVTKLLKMGADPDIGQDFAITNTEENRDTQYRNATALHLATIRNYTGIMRVLLAYGANVNATYERNGIIDITALYDVRSLEAAKILVDEFGADIFISQSMHWVNEVKKLERTTSPIISAVKKEHPDIAAFLTQKGATIGKNPDLMYNPNRKLKYALNDIYYHVKDKSTFIEIEGNSEKIYKTKFDELVEIAKNWVRVGATDIPETRGEDATEKYNERDEVGDASETRNKVMDMVMNQLHELKKELFPGEGIVSKGSDRSR